ncbi:MAG TPA: ankyrin repeat domain-containing protein [Candidatus Angelobacter sp.]
MFPNPQDALPLPPRPNLEQYRKLAKDLLKAARSTDEGALRIWSRRWIKRLVKLGGLEITRQMPIAEERWARQVEEFAQRELGGKRNLSQAQFVIARASGFQSWRWLVDHIQGMGRKASHVAEFEEAAEAIVNGYLAGLRRLLRRDPELVRVRSTREHRATLLHYVSANGVEGYRQKTPKNIVQIAEVLLQAGAEVDAAADVYGGGATTLGLAATSCHPEAAGVQNALLQLLLDHGAAIEQPGAAGNKDTAITGCLANGRGAAAEFLASRGAQLDLEGAAGVGRLDVVKSFFNPDGTLKSTATTEQMKSGFAWACEYGHTSVVEFLLRQGIELPIKLKHNGQTGLHWAAYGGHSDVVRLLLEQSAPVNIKDDTYSGTPLGWALYGWGESPKRGSYYEVVALLVKAGANEEAKWLADPDRGMPLTAKIQADPRMLAALKGETPR